MRRTGDEPPTGKPLIPSPTPTSVDITRLVLDPPTARPLCLIGCLRTTFSALTAPTEDMAVVAQMNANACILLDTARGRPNEQRRFECALLLALAWRRGVPPSAEAHNLLIAHSARGTRIGGESLLVPAAATVAQTVSEREILVRRRARLTGREAAHRLFHAADAGVDPRPRRCSLAACTCRMRGPLRLG